MTQKDFEDMTLEEKERTIMTPFFQFLEKYADKNYASAVEFKTFREFHETAAQRRQEIIELKLENLEDKVISIKDDLKTDMIDLKKSVAGFIENCTGPVHARILDSYRLWLIILSTLIGCILAALGFGEWVLNHIPK